MKAPLSLFTLLTFLLGSCHMDAYYANKRISHQENVKMLQTVEIFAGEGQKKLSDNTAEDFSLNENELVLQAGYPDSIHVNTSTNPVAKKQKKENKTSSRQTETNVKGVPIYDPGKERTTLKTSKNDTEPGIWVFWGSIVLVSVVVGLLTKSVWIGLLTFGGILVLLALLIFIFVLLFIV